MRADPDLRARLRAGDHATAADLVVRELGPKVLARLRALLPAQGEADEAYSRWAEKVWRGLPAFAWRSSLERWVSRVARNAALDVRDEAARRRERRFRTGEVSRVAALSGASTAGWKERRQEALGALRRALAPEEQRLLDLRVTQRLPWREVAAQLQREGEDVDEGAAMKRFERLKGRLGREARRLGLR